MGASTPLCASLWCAEPIWTHFSASWSVGETQEYFKKALKTVADSGEILRAAQSMPRRLQAVLDANGQATKY